MNIVDLINEIAELIEAPLVNQPTELIDDFQSFLKLTGNKQSAWRLQQSVNMYIHRRRHAYLPASALHIHYGFQPTHDAVMAVIQEDYNPNGFNVK